MTAFEELDTSIRFEFDAEGGITAKRGIICDWSDWESLASEILQYADGTAALFAKFPGYTNLYCTNVAVEPFQATIATDSVTGMTDPATQIAAFQGKAILTLQYRTVLSDLNGTNFNGATVPEAVYVDYVVNGQDEFITLEASDCRWTNQPAVPVKAPATKLITLKQHVLNFYNVRTPPFGYMDALKGHVNEFQWLGFKPETLLFSSPSLQTRMLINGRANLTLGWNIAYTFVERSIVEGSSTYGWNHLWRGKTATVAGGWDKLKRDDGSLLYLTGTFDPLFNF